MVLAALVWSADTVVSTAGAVVVQPVEVAVTVMLTVAGAEVAWPSLAVNVKESVPVLSASSVAVQMTVV